MFDSTYELDLTTIVDKGDLNDNNLISEGFLNAIALGVALSVMGMFHSHYPKKVIVFTARQNLCVCFVRSCMV